MRAWPEPSTSGGGFSLAQDLLGDAPPVRVFDTRTRLIRALEPESVARMYVCGITPYDATHLGHAATYVAFDLLNRAWRATGLDVHYVQNVTDVDDPLLVRANETAEDWRALADRQIELYRHDMTALRVLPPAHLVGAVEAIPDIVDLIDRLAAAGAVYRVDDDLYLRVAQDPAFGEVSRLGADAMIRVSRENGGDPNRPGKEQPLDALLWRAERDGEPSWPTRLGRGRPGWHVECAAISMRHLGTSFDVQGGGHDLTFPHHEMSAAHAQLVTSEPFALAYVHAGLVGYEGEKMSKSRGNLVFVSVLRQAGVDPRVLRLALLAHHYRSDWEWTGDQLATAAERLDAWRRAVELDLPGGEDAARAVRDRMADDLDAPGALARMDEWAAQPPSRAEEGTGRLVAAVVESSLGVDLG